MVDAAPAVQALAGFRNGTEGSNPSLSATQSEVQRNPPGLPLKIARNGRNSASFTFKPDRRKCPAQSCRQAFAPFSLGGIRAVRFQRTPSGECIAITNR